MTRFVAVLLLLASTTVAAAQPAPLNCETAFAERNALAVQEAEMLRQEVHDGRLSRSGRDRLSAIRQRRRRLLVCG